MSLKPTLYERAFLLTGELTSFAEIRWQLIREGYDAVDAKLMSSTLRHDIEQLCSLTAQRLADFGATLH